MDLKQEYKILKTVNDKKKLEPLFEKEGFSEEDVIEFYKENYTLFRTYNNRFDSDNPHISDNYELTEKGLARLKIIEKELD